MKKNLHVAANSADYPNKFVPDYARMVGNETQGSKNEFIFIGDGSGIGGGFKFSVGKRNLWYGIKFCFLAREYSSIIFHSTPSKYLLLFLILRFLIFRSIRIYFVLWGGEFKFSGGGGVHGRLIALLNKLAMQCSDGFITYLKSDYEKAVQLSGNHRAKWIDIDGVYPSNSLTATAPSRSKKICRVLIGASALERNKHFEIIERLAKKSVAAEVEYIIPLSYGDRRYADKVFQYAEAMLVGDLKPLFGFMERDEYLKLLSTIDIAFFNNEGQQGMGNIRNLLGFGAQVFLNPQSDSYRYFLNLGLKVFDITDNSIVIEQALMESNITRAHALFSREQLVKQTENFLQNA